MPEPLTNDQIRQWRTDSLTCPEPISLDRMVVELADQVLHLRAQRDSLFEAANRSLELRRALAAELETERVGHRTFLARFAVADGQRKAGSAQLDTVRADRDHLLAMLGEMFHLKELISDEPSAWVFSKRTDGVWVVWHEDYPDEGAIPLEDTAEHLEAAHG